ncbi:hypothetical protein HN777_00290 [Candidatus Woesearchaeota archaeon]|mgnify:CR=1 FL=1|jgi:hypothetical protein|nr:hypothetical protein [Candidatus Woesearchaeota archaeon]MBT7402213.1 hypothetical protein [Candidatus Woesearchaeota archaeon]
MVVIEFDKKQGMYVFSKDQTPIPEDPIRSERVAQYVHAQASAIPAEKIFERSQISRIQRERREKRERIIKQNNSQHLEDKI